MRDNKLGEREQTIKKLLEANRVLREDQRKETERYTILENKYKDILVKYRVLATENTKYEEMMFQMKTGGNINNYQSYLMDDGK